MRGVKINLIGVSKMALDRFDDTPNSCVESRMLFTVMLLEYIYMCVLLHGEDIMKVSMNEYVYICSVKLGCFTSVKLQSLCMTT